MEIATFLAINGFGHLLLVAARMTSTLFALELGASPLVVGVIMALYAALPMLMSVSTGRLIDRIGPRPPLLAAYCGLLAGAALPFAFPQVWALMAAAVLLGVSFMYVHIGMNSVFGAYGGPERRAQNFAWHSIGFSISGSAGPLVAGYAIEGLGHRAAFGLFALFPLAGLVLLLLRRRPLPRPERKPAGGARERVADLFRHPGLRNLFVLSGIMAMGWDLYLFLMPLYGAGIGLSASTIGLVMASFSVATFVVRLAVTIVARRVRPWTIITGALACAGLAYALLPLVQLPWLLMAVSFLLGLGLGCAQPAIMSLLYEAAPPGRQGEAVGVRTTMINASQTLIPLTSGALSAALGLGPVFWALAAALLATAWTTRRRTRRPRIE